MTGHRRVLAMPSDRHLPSACFYRPYEPDPKASTAATPGLLLAVVKKACRDDSAISGGAE